jgi:hypothetical protein
VTGAMVALFAAALATVGTVLGDLVSAEVRHRLDRIPMQIVALAARRLPPLVREDRAQEWAAELAAILEQRGASKLPITRLVIGLRFAFGIWSSPRPAGSGESGRRRGHPSSLRAC